MITRVLWLNSKPYNNELSQGLALTTIPSVLMNKHLNQFLRNKPHFPSNISQKLDEVKVLFLTYKLTLNRVNEEQRK